MLRKDCSFSWTIKVKCLFWIVSAPFNFWLRSLKAYGNKFQSLFSEQQNLSVLEHFNLFFSSRRCRKIKNWCNHWISSWILSEHVDLFCLGTGIQIVHTLVISHKLTDMVLVVFAGIYLDGLWSRMIEICEKRLRRKCFKSPYNHKWKKSNFKQLKLGWEKILQSHSNWGDKTKFFIFVTVVVLFCSSISVDYVMKAKMR